MTSEVCLLNRFGAVLAADSATTVSRWDPDTNVWTYRYFKGTNKVFQLSAHHPVGLMIYENIAIHGVPWEVLVKEFRAVLKGTAHASPRAYAGAFFDFLKGNRNEPRLALDLNGLKKDPALLTRTTGILHRHETMKYLPSPVVESAAKLLLEKLPDELDFLKIMRLKSDQLLPLRHLTIKFYGYYRWAIGFTLFFAALIIFLLRDKRKIALSLGIALLLAGLLLFIPYLGSEAVTAKIFSKYRGSAPEVVKALSGSFIRDFFGVYVLSPVMLSLAGLTGLVTGLFVFKKGT